MSATHPHPTAARCRFAVVVVSDTRTSRDDLSGPVARERIAAAGHEVVASSIVPDDSDALRTALCERLRDDRVDAVLALGGTGISARDRTPEVVSALVDLRLDGYGERFRALSWDEIGSAAMLSRATGGIAAGKPLFATPGSPKAVRLALDRLILPEIGHLLGELRKHAAPG